MPRTILIVDDQKNIRTSLSRSLSIEGFACLTAETVGDGLRVLVDEAVDALLLDVKLPDGDGREILDWMARHRPDVPVVVMSGHGNVDMALDAVRRGAHDFLEKPLSTKKLLVTLANALRFAGQSQELASLKRELAGRHQLLGASRAMEELRQTIALAAPTNGRVLVTGESGTGKELVAHAVHRGSKRRDGPFVKLNCAAIPSELIESELFGHERGAFTGAHAARKGKFELAHGGTLFLDEIGDMRLDVQAKLLRALQEGEIERVGGARPIRVDVRVVAATNKDLASAIREGDFREDLYYRLHVVPIEVPPLRARRSDVPELARAFVAQACADNGIRPKVLSPEALELLGRQDWPGNVRELRNACERLVILSPGDTIEGAHVRLRVAGGAARATALYRPGATLRELVAEAERAIVVGALDAHDGHMTRTAEALGLERSHLYKKLRALGIRRDAGGDDGETR